MGSAIELDHRTDDRWFQNFKYFWLGTIFTQWEAYSRVRLSFLTEAVIINRFGDYDDQSYIVWGRTPKARDRIGCSPIRFSIRVIALNQDLQGFGVHESHEGAPST